MKTKKNGENMKRGFAYTAFEIREFKEIKHKILNLIPLFREFFAHVQRAYKKQNCTVHKFAVSIGISYGEARDIINKTRAVHRGRALEQTCKYLGLNSLAERIKIASSGITDRYISLALYSPETVEVVFALLEAHTSHTKARANRECFAQLFDEDIRQIIPGAMYCSTEALQELDSNPSMVSRILETLTSPQFAEKAEKLLVQISSKSSQKAQELVNLIKSMLESYFENRLIIANELGISYTKLHQAELGKMPAHIIDEVIALAKALLARKKERFSEEKQTESLPNEQEKSDDAEKSDADDKSASLILIKTSVKHEKAEQYREQTPKADGTTIPIEQVGGETTSLGIKFCLTESGFTCLDWEPSDEMLEKIERFLEIARAHLNVLSQIKDDKTRAKIRERLTPQIEELHRSVRLFASEYPCRLTDIFDAERAFLENHSSSKHGKQRKTGR